MGLLPRLAAIAVVVALCAASCAPHASAAAGDAARPADGPRPSPSSPANNGPDVGPPARAPQPSSDAQDESAVGTVNALSIRNPFCDEPGLGRAERRNCRVTGTPEGRYPTSNYGFDVHIDTGLDNVSGNFAAMIAQIAGAIWTFCLFVLNIVLTVIGWAFALSPFTDNGAMREIDAGLGSFYRAFTEPWLVVAMVALGAWALYRAVVRREVTATIGATVLSVALMLAALWVIHAPRETIGTLSGWVNKAALSVLAAPQSGSLSNPVGDYGEATDRVWSQMTMPGFAALNFSNSDWALSAPDPELVATSNRYACADAAYLAQLPPEKADQIIFGSEHTGGVLGIGGSDHTTCENLDEIAPAPRTNAEIWLRNSPGSLARERLWTEHTDDAPYSSYFAIQGEGGAGTRLPLALLIALGLLGGILLLAWIALRLFMQTAVAFVLVLLAPLALFLPAFGERGRRGFAAWGQTLLGALVSKLVYAALLSVVLLATTVIGSLVSGEGGIGATMAFLAMAALWWAVFLYRSTLLAFVTVSREADEGHSRLGAALGLSSMARLGRQLVAGRGGSGAGPRRGLRAAKDAVVGDRHDRREATGLVARADLDRRAEQRLNRRLAAEQKVIDSQRERRGELLATGRERSNLLEKARRHRAAARTASDPKNRLGHERAGEAALRRAHALRVRQGELRGELGNHAGRESQAIAFVAEANERARRSGKRWSAAELGQAREALRAESDRPVADPAHAWRAGMAPERYAALRGAERERVHAEVARQLADDRRAFGSIPDRPRGVVDARASRAYRRTLRTRDGGGQRLREERAAITRRRRAVHRRARRGLSR